MGATMAMVCWAITMSCSQVMSMGDAAEVYAHSPANNPPTLYRLVKPYPGGPDPIVTCYTHRMTGEQGCGTIPFPEKHLNLVNLSKYALEKVR